MQFPKPNFSSSKPLSEQVSAIIEQKILGREIPVGKKIPPQEELRKAFGVGLVTVKTALADLTRQGYISRRPKHGTIVISAKPGREAAAAEKNTVCLVVCTGIEKQT